MVRYIWTKSGFVDANGNRMVMPERDGLCAPMVASDISPYQSPMDGRWITSRSEARYDLDKHGMRVLEPSESPTQGKIKNAKFAAKRGFKVSEEYRDLPQNKVST